MPELPDVDVYVERLKERIAGAILGDVRVSKPFLVRTVDPPLSRLCEQRVIDVRRIGKRIAIGLEGELWAVIHLMIAGRLLWKSSPARIGGKHQLAAFDFDSGCLVLTEAGSKKRASLHVLHGDSALRAHDPGGVEPLQCAFAEFDAVLRAENRTLKRALTNPRSISGIGNAYSDEILHAACLSPVRLTRTLDENEVRRLYDATRTILVTARTQLLNASRNSFPTKVTAFRKEMAVHGKYGEPCPDCQATIARIRYKSNETNYCPRCQTGGKLLADRSLSRLLKDDWPSAV